MSSNKISENEINALLEAFSDSCKDNYGRSYQTIFFRLIITLLNIYALAFLITYIFLKDQIIADGATLIAIHGRAQITFWFMAALNIALHFNLGFKAVVITFLIYAINSTIDNFILLGALIDFLNMPYFSLMIITRPLFIIGLIFLLIIHKEE